MIFMPTLTTYGHRIHHAEDAGPDRASDRLVGHCKVNTIVFLLKVQMPFSTASLGPIVYVCSFK
jgi:hypothetical protein